MMFFQKWYGSVCFLLVCSLLLFASEPQIDVSGTVTCDGSPVEGAAVSLVGYPEMNDSTDASGTFSLSNIVGITNKAGFHHSSSDMRLNGTTLEFTSLREKSNGTLRLFSGNGREVTAIELNGLSVGAHSVALPELSAGFYILSLMVDGSTLRRKLINTGNGMYLDRSTYSVAAEMQQISKRKTMIAADQLKVEKTGYVTTFFDITSLEVDNLEVVVEKEPEVVECAEFEVPSFTELKDNPKMPDPFTFLNGKKMTRKSEWTCRRKEISALAQEFIYGEKPPKPEIVEAVFSNGELDITCSNGENAISFKVGISSVPSGNGPFPAFILFDETMSVPSTVAKINYSTIFDKIATQNCPGFNRPSGGNSGLFYDLYPHLKSTGSLMAWAWGVSRIIDALEMTEGHKIDPTKLATQGCSRNGKGAVISGIFDERVALPMSMSSGSGAISGWRIAETQGDVQKAQQIYGECTWMGDAFQQFGTAVSKLPIDQHEVLALAWPRPLLVLEGTDDSWNCPTCCYQTMKYTQMIYEALGLKDYIGFAHPGHRHCQQGSNVTSKEYFNAFIDRFLLGKTNVNTELFSESFDFDEAKWLDGEIPDLE